MVDLFCQLRLRGAQKVHAGAQAQHVQRIDDESSVAALRATLPTEQPLARVLRRLGERRVHNLHQ